MIVKKWIPVDLMDCIIDYGRIQFDTKEECDAWLGKDSIASIMFTSKEVDVNTDALTEVGEEWKRKLEEVWIKNNMYKFHASLRPAFLAMSFDDQMKFIYECINMPFDGKTYERTTHLDGHLETTRFDESFDEDFTQVDVSKPFAIDENGKWYNT